MFLFGSLMRSRIPAIFTKPVIHKAMRRAASATRRSRYCKLDYLFGM
jgi:hypothetical protein